MAVEFKLEQIWISTIWNEANHATVLAAYARLYDTVNTRRIRWIQAQMAGELTGAEQLQLLDRARDLLAELHTRETHPSHGTNIDTDRVQDRPPLSPPRADAAPTAPNR